MNEAQKAAFETALQEVKDPEIPSISVLELGIITAMAFEGGKASITMTPTFSGCPAVDYMQKDIHAAISALDFVDEAIVNVDFSVPWTSNRISEAGRKKLQEFGLAAPARHNGTVELTDIEAAHCPNCGSPNTTLNTMFGPTLCRAIHRCFECLEPFESFKPL